MAREQHARRPLPARTARFSPERRTPSNDAEARFASALQNLRHVAATGGFSPEYCVQLAVEATALRGRILALEKQSSERAISDLRQRISALEKERDTLTGRVAALAARETDVENIRRQLLARHAALLDQERDLAAITLEQKRLLRDHFMHLAKGA